MGSSPEDGIVRMRLQGNIRSQALHPGRLKAHSLASLENSDAPPFAPAEFQRTPAPRGVGGSRHLREITKAIRCEKVDEPVRLDEGDFGEQW